MQKKVMVGLIVPALFYILNYGLLKVPDNLIEIVMVTTITFMTMFVYGKTNDYLNPIVYFPILYFLLYWVGDFDMGIGYKPATQLMWWYYYLGLIGFYIGALLISYVKVKPKSYIKTDWLSQDARCIFLAIYMVCILCKIITYRQYGIPMLVSNVDATRQSIAEGTGLLKVLSSAHTILAVFYFYDLVSRIQNKQHFRFSNVLILLCSLFVSILDGSRLLIIQMVLPMFFIFILKVRKIKLKNIILIGVLLLIFISANKFIRNVIENPEYLAFVLSNRNSSLITNIWMSGFNSFRVAIEDLRRLIEIVPSESGYTYGSMFMNSILTVLPGKQVVIGYYVADLLGLSFDGMGAATTILGMFYLDGGPIMIFIGMFLFGVFVQNNYKKYIQHQNVCLYSLIGVYIIYYSVLCLRTNVMPTIEPLLCMFYFWAFSFIARCVRIGGK